MTYNKIELLKLICLFLLYFVQALPYGFQSRYLPLLMRKQGISLTSLGLYKLLLIPWICKFFISAFIVDKYRSKKFWLLFTMFMLSFLSFMGIFFDSFYELAVLIFLLNTASATQDICVDWYAISNLRQEDLGLGNTIQVAAFKIGTLFSGGVLVYFMDYISSISIAFIILGMIYFVCFVLLKLLLIDTKQLSENQETNKSLESISNKQRLLLLHQSPGTYWICIFVLIYKLGEQSSLNMLPIYLIDREVSSQTIGFWTGIVGQSLSISGSLISGIILKKKNSSAISWLKFATLIRIIPIVLISIILTLFESSNEKNINDSYSLNCLLCLAMIQLFFSGFLTTFTFTTMMEFSYLAPKNIQATHFSLIATCEVLGKLLLQPLVGSFTDHFGYIKAFILFTWLYFISMLSFRYTPKLKSK